MFGKLIKYTLYSALAYLSLIGLIIQPLIQKGLIYLHWINYPFPSSLKEPHVFGFPKNEVRNFNIKTSDGFLLGAWQFLPLSVHKEALLSHGDEYDFGDDFYISKLRDSKRDVVLYLHGNAANRGSSVRYPTYDSVVSGLDSHLITIDYRGFGDSSGTPSEEGLFQDGLAAWTWLMDQGVQSSRVTVMGHSLGTGVSSRLVSHLNSLKVYPKSMILTAPYVSIEKLMFDYRIFFLFPILYPLKFIPDHERLANKFLQHRFDTFSRISKIQTPFLLFHGAKDTEIPSSHSWRLFNHTLETHAGSDKSFISTDLPDGVGKCHQISFSRDFSSSQTKPLHIKLVEILKASHNTVTDYPAYPKEIASFWKLISD